MSQNQVVVAAVQFSPITGDVTANLHTAQQYVFEAFVKGARIVVLPELCLAGQGLSKNDMMFCSQQSNGYQTEAFMSLCRKYNGVVVFGYPELEDGVLYNSAAVVGPTGLIGNSRKCNLEGSDFMWAKAAKNFSHPLIVHNACRIGVLLSQDVKNVEENRDSKFYRSKDVDVICVPMNADLVNVPDSKWVSLAESTKAAVVISNVIHEDKNTISGGSCIIDRQLTVWSNNFTKTAPTIVGGIVEL